MNNGTEQRNLKGRKVEGEWGRNGELNLSKSAGSAGITNKLRRDCHASLAMTSR
jgi:hypothetical protein